MVGERTAEEVKIQIGTALPLERELSDGGPRPRPHRRPAAHDPDHELRGDGGDRGAAPAARRRRAAVLEQTPPELSSDIIDKGMVMSGGGSLLRNIDKLLTQVTGVPATSPRTR
jgi:rod shape-determining protein MreB